MAGLFSKSCEYALRAALYVAAQGPGSTTKVREIGARLGIPTSFLSKIAQTLTQAGIFQATRGPAGGLTLARPARDIRLIEVVEAIDGADLFHRCALGLPGCGHRTPCPLHDSWAPLRNGIHRMIADATLENVSADLLSRRLRLGDPSKDAGSDS